MTRVGRYRLVRPLGQGAHASVHEAVVDGDPAAAPVALKRLLPHVQLLRPEALDRLRREVVAARALAHPGIVRLLDAGQAEGGPFVVYELVRGARPITHAFARLPLAARVRLVRDAARAAGAAHARGVIHRDLAPGNVLVDDAGQVRLTDFGLAWVDGEARLTLTGAVLGTPATIAPEAALAGSHAATSPRVDVWALGVLLFEALTGRPPFEDALLGAPERPAPAASELVPSLPASLDAVSRRALAPRPEERFPDGEALAAALDEALGELGTQRDVGPVAHRPTPAPAPSSGRPPAVGAGTVLGGYTLVSVLGEGGMAQVWRARDATLERDVALKVLPTTHGADRKSRALRELEAASRVRHPNVVAIHGAGEAPGCLFLVMDLVDGDSLDKLIAADALEPARAVELLGGVARALEALHAQGIVHRDVKPANVLVGQDGVARLTDFGVARVLDADRLTKTNQVIGTPYYMPLEQLQGRPVDERADVYALGAVLYEALTRKLPADGETLQALAEAKQEPPLPPSHVRAGLDGPLDAICLKALAIAPEDRYASMGQLADDLERWLSGERVLAVAPRRRRRIPALAVVGALVVVALGVTAAVLSRERVPAAAQLAALRRDLEARASRARALAPLEVDEARERLAALPPDEAAEERAALETWVRLVGLARGEVASDAAPPAPGESSPSALALRGGLLALRDADPAGAVDALDRVKAGGVRWVELDRWRYRALAARGVDDRILAERLLESLPEATRLGVDEETVRRLEVACLAALGRSADAAAGLARLTAPPPGLRWAVGVTVAAEHIGAGRVVEANAALKPLVRPERPATPREVETAARAVELVAPMVRTAAKELRIYTDLEVARLQATLQLHARLAPDRTPGAELRTPLLRSILQSSANQTEPMVLVALAEVYPDDAEVLQLTTEALAFDQKTEGDESAHIVRLARRAVTKGVAAGRTRARVILVRHLLFARLLDEAAMELATVEVELFDRIPEGLPAEDVALFRGQVPLYRARLHDARGDLEGALRTLDAAGPAAELVAGERIRLRFDLLQRLGRTEEAAAAALAYIRAPLTVGPNRKAVADHVWRILVPRRAWEKLRAFADELHRDRIGANGVWSVRAALLHAVEGDLAAAARLIESVRPSEHGSLVPESLLRRLRAGERTAVRDLLLHEKEDPAVWGVGAP